MCEKLLELICSEMLRELDRLEQCLMGPSSPAGEEGAAASFRFFLRGDSAGAVPRLTPRSVGTPHRVQLDLPGKRET
jgi:hypothetical protein